MNRRVLFALALAPLAACASNPGLTLPPLELESKVAVDYRAEVTGVDRLEDLIEVGEYERAGGGELFTLDCHFVVLDTDSARRLLGWEPLGPSAWTASAVGIERVRDAAAAYRGVGHFSSSTLSLYDDQLGYVTVMNQTAYISGFQVEASDRALVADPQIDVVTDGMLLSARGDVREGGRSVGLDLELVLSDLQLPIPSFEAVVPGGTVPVTIQQPVASAQRVGLEVELDREHGLVLQALVAGSADEHLFAFVTVRTVPEQSPNDSI